MAALLSYCTNVHPGRSLEEVERRLDEYTVPVQANLGEPIGAGLWLSNSVVRELCDSAESLRAFCERFRSRELTCCTMNAFPYGDFHGERVKQAVYVPDWSDPRRMEYTMRCARILVELLPEGTEGSISTLPLGYGPGSRDGLIAESVEQLIAVARSLDELYSETGKLVRLAIEPEPYCLLERTDATVDFFETSLRVRADDAGLLDATNRHIGVCFDVCHQSVEFEDVAASIAAFQSADVRINKVHVTCALQLDHPRENPDGLRALADFVEPRYLHQTFAQTGSGAILRSPDLTETLVRRPSQPWLDAAAWRVHFHVPVHVEAIGSLSTTRPDLKRALAALSLLDSPSHLEVETYTWSVLPGGRQMGLVDGLTQELAGTRQLLAELAAGPSG